MSSNHLSPEKVNYNVIDHIPHALYYIPMTITLISHASKAMLKILQVRLQQKVHQWTVNLQMFKLILEKAEEPEIKLPTPDGSSKKQEISRKTSISALLTMRKPLTVWITTNCRKFLKS